MTDFGKNFIQKPVFCVFISANSFFGQGLGFQKKKKEIKFILN